MDWASGLELEDFLSRNPSMRLSKLSADIVELKGIYQLDAQMEGFKHVRDAFELTITLSHRYPSKLPVVVETGGRIPRNHDHHVNENGSLCLGSDIKLKSILRTDQCVCAFAKKCLTPFLYSLSYKIKYGVFPYGELAHGETGLVHDYESLFGVTGKRAVLGVLSALASRKRVANKSPCPCGCHRRLGRCDYRYVVAQWRGLDRRRWFREHLKSFQPIEKPNKKRRQKKINSAQT
ncbi:MAG: hypothetical protein NXH95_15865 [Pseudomonadaceae bacterium]|nr:hypothetical protein [Pseudomonadaceae bacterium]